MEQGGVYLNGLKKNILSEFQWRENVVLVPQYHENYIFNDTFLMNSLMGSGWPPLPEQIKKFN